MFREPMGIPSQSFKTFTNSKKKPPKPTKVASIWNINFLKGLQNGSGLNLHQSLEREDSILDNKKFLLTIKEFSKISMELMPKKPSLPQSPQYSAFQSILERSETDSSVNAPTKTLELVPRMRDKELDIGTWKNTQGNESTLQKDRV